MSDKSKNSGFTLVETLIAISVVSVTIAAATQLTISSNRIGKQMMAQFKAFHIAEEGIEIVRNMRDSNWLQNKDWEKGLSNGFFTITKTSSGYPWRLDKTAGVARQPEKDGMSQIIEIKTNTDASIQLSSRVTYIFSNKEREVELTAQLTNWKKGPL